MNEQALRRVLEGGGGIPGRLLRAAMRAPELLYGGAMKARRGLYGAGLLASFKAPLPVVSVGNLVMGGTGKTPFVVMLAKEFLKRGVTPGILLRGYRQGETGDSDEALLYRRHCPETVVVARSDRVRGAETAAAAGAEILLLDDGFQHLRLRRDMDTVLIDAMCPWGSGRTIPAGTLREPKSVLRKADAIVITRSDQSGGSKLGELLGEIRGIAPRVPVFTARHRVSGLDRLDGGAVPLERLRELPVFALSGIARPEAFWRTLEQAGAAVAGAFGLPDHGDFPARDVRNILNEAKKAGGVVVVTEKDARRKALCDLRERSGIWVLGVEQELDALDGYMELLWRKSSLPGGYGDVL